MIPNLSNSGNPEFSTAELDRLFDFQISTSSPKKLTASSLYISKVVDHEGLAVKVHRKLIKEGLLTEDPPAVHTKKIGRNLTHHFALLPVFGQKRMVCLLFAWEEELMRFRLLEEEEAELKVIIEEEQRDGGNVGEMEKRLLELEGLKKLLPSLRGHEAREAEKLPAYTAT